ncbi:aspartate/glutamate racemase family protein [Nocardioides massiliensis]|uniref:Aspartate racemase n=1 Tax=Nocardioides massiliensis TaxID=1325935 RepID=A0ABT9NJE5_9ACTN|nr:amino acid racemase [Nocardioides massiliensis]MDP9820349.1 aspartate racemase [Nocardioides massiliensis]
MQTIGLLGGMGWESSAHYYKLLNQGVEQRLGGLHSARSVMVSVDFAEVSALEAEERWDEVAAILADAAKRAEAGGSDFLVLCTTAFHRVAEQVADAVDIDVLHLGDVLAERIRERGLTSVALLGTAFTMGRKFFSDRLEANGVQVLVPPAEQHDTINRIIYDELVHGRVEDGSRKHVVQQIHDLWDAGAQSAILGCAELELLVHQHDVEVPLFGSTELHVAAALDRALA